VVNVIYLAITLGSNFTDVDTLACKFGTIAPVGAVFVSELKIICTAPSHAPSYYTDPTAGVVQAGAYTRPPFGSTCAVVVIETTQHTPQKELMLSSKVDECKPLRAGVCQRQRLRLHRQQQYHLLRAW
jgi:hypothetical protein